MAAFFVFGAAMSGLACLRLAFAGGPLEHIWRVNPEARVAFAKIGPWSIVLMAVVCAACACAALGLWKHWFWGYVLAIAVLTINLVGDTVSAILRTDPITLIGLPIGGFFIAYLVRPKIRALFARSTDA